VAKRGRQNRAVGDIANAAKLPGWQSGLWDQNVKVGIPFESAPEKKANSGGETRGVSSARRKNKMRVDTMEVEGGSRKGNHW